MFLFALTIGLKFIKNKDKDKTSSFSSFLFLLLYLQSGRQALRCCEISSGISVKMAKKFDFGDSPKGPKVDLKVVGEQR
jgi:hypothetical protein